MRPLQRIPWEILRRSDNPEADEPLGAYQVALHVVSAVRYDMKELPTGTHLKASEHHVTLLLPFVSVDCAGAKLSVEGAGQLITHSLGGTEDDDSCATGK